MRARLSARLETGVDAPVALALSGGGDSIALLRVAADWAKDNGRRLLALTVDHGLNPDSARWSVFAEKAARDIGADWRGLSWAGPRPTAGLPAAARRARHALIADAAREAGARVILFAHTADDIAEADVMRAEGSTLGRVRDWGPSPVWPEGRGLMLLRPMLDAGRTEIRAWLSARGAAWIDDPANEDPRYARSRARLTLVSSGRDGSRRNWSAVAPGCGHDGPPAGRPGPPPTGEGWFDLTRDIDVSTLSAALVCAGGGERRPKGDRLTALVARLRSGERFTASLCGARVAVDDDRVLITREAGELTRRPPPRLALRPGIEAVWDGRWAITADSPGWSVLPAAGRLAALSDAERTLLKALPAAARGGEPVLVRDGDGAPVLARTAAVAHSLVEQRLARALDRMTHERAPGAVLHGATARKLLFST